MSIEANHLSKKIGKNTVLNDVSCRFDPGRLHVLKGLNGSGKTMLLRALAGLIHLDSGQVLIDGKVLKKDIEFPPSIGLLVDSPSFIARFTGFQNLNMLASIKSLIGPQEIRQVIERVGLDPSDSRPYSKYSLGMKKRLGIACATMENPQIVILDEPFNALDQRGIDMAIEIISSIKDDNRTIIVASHGEDELADIEDTRIILEHGRIMSDSQTAPVRINADVR
jgi:ABC-2 type transport system ATP-binding protein